MEEIYLSHNLLGDNLSPVFSTSEFQNLRSLRVLDLSHNGLTGIADNLIKGCEGLKVRVSSKSGIKVDKILSPFILLVRESSSRRTVTWIIL